MCKYICFIILPLAVLFASCPAGPVSTTTFVDSVRAVCASMRPECDNKPAVEIDVFMNDVTNKKKWVDTVIVCCALAPDFADSLKSLQKEVDDQNFDGKEKKVAGVTMFTYKATNSDFKGVTIKTPKANFSLDPARMKKFLADIEDAVRKCCI